MHSCHTQICNFPVFMVYSIDEWRYAMTFWSVSILILLVLSGICFLMDFIERDNRRK